MDEQRNRFGIIGYGRFGHLVAPYLAGDGQVAVHDPKVSAATLPAGCFPASLADAAASHVVVLCVPIRSLYDVLADIAPYLLPGAVVFDVASVKMKPMEWMERLVPEHVDYVGSHPLFGPDSAPHNLSDQKIVLVPGRIAEERFQRGRRYLQSKGLRIIQTTAENHDRSMARTQAFTHWLGRALGGLELKPEALDTQGYRLLQDVESFVSRDTWELFEDMLRYNPFAAEVRDGFRRALDEIDERLARLDSTQEGAT